MEGGKYLMSSNIDERIVEMRFDNKQFESNVQTSIKSLDNLKTGLNLDDSARSLSNLEKAGRTFSLAGIAEGVDNISSKFTALGIIGITALQNITNSAINAGKRLISSLTVDPIKTGLQEYETKMNAITTILTNTESKGTTLDEVNKTLNELNTYADKTIYNFAEMTRNIGTFTAAGIGLEESATAIKGIANLAAGSGSTSAQASTAMYQLSQALASGSVKLQDWNSVVNAGMGGELFQNALKDMAKQMGIVVDESVPFRESLKDGWVTSEVLTKTLAKFAEDESLLKAATQVKTFTQLLDTMKESVQSGWAQSWENIIGDREEAAQLFTAINDGFGDIVGSSAEARNAMLLFWKDNGGRDAIIDSLANAFKGLQSVLSPISEAFREVFPPMTGERLVQISEGIRELTEKFKIGETTSNNLKRTFKGLFAILDIGKQAVFAIGNGIGDLIGYLLPAGDGILSITAGIGDFFVALDEAIKSSDAFNVAIEKLGNFLKPIADGVKEAVGKIIDAFKSFSGVDLSGLDSFSERVKTRFEPFTKLGEFVETIFAKISGVIKKVAPVFFALATVIGNAFDKMRQNIVGALDNAEFNSIFDIVNGGLFAAILLGLRTFIKSLTDITDSAGGFMDGLTGILDGVKGSLEAYQSSLKANTLLKIAGAIGILAAALLVLSLIDSEKLTVALAAMTTMFIELFGSMAIFEKIVGSEGFKGIGKVTVAMIGISVAILILSTAMTKLAELDWNGLAKGLVGVGALMTMLVASTKVLSANSGAVIKGSLGLILFATAINILVSAVEKLSLLDTDALVKGLVGVGVVMAELALFMKATNMSKMGVLKGAGILILAAAINVLATAVGKFGEMDTGAMLKGLAGVGLVLAELALFVNLTGDAKRVISTAIGLTILGAAMLIFAEAVGNMGSLSWEEIGKGLLTMAGALTIITVALNFMPKNMILTGTGLVIVASALLIMAKALEDMGGMSWEEIGKGLLTLAGSLTIIAVAMAFMTTALPGAAALLIVAAALAIIAPVLKTLGEMSLSEIGKGLLALAGVFAVIGVAGLLLAPLTPVILGLSAAIALFGIGCLAVGAGILAFSAGITALSIAGTAGAAALVLFVTSIVGLIPFVLVTLAQGIVDFVRVIGEGAPVIAEAVKSIILAILDVLVTVTPVVVESLYVLLTTILNTMVEYIPQITDAGMKIIIGFLKGIADNIQAVVETAIDIVINFLEGIASKIPDVIQSGIDLILAFVNGLADAIRGNTDAMINAFNNLWSAIIEAGIKTLKNSISMFLDMGKKIMDSGFVQGIKDKITAFVDTVKGMVTDGIDATTDKIGDWVQAGKDLIGGFIQGIKDMASSVVDSVKGVVNSAIDGAKKLLGINSPSRVFAEIGRYSDEGMVVGLTKFAGKVVNAAKEVGQGAIDGLKGSMSKIADVVSGNIDINPTIRPVLDLTDVEAGGDKLNALFSQSRGINVSSVTGKIPVIGQASDSVNPQSTSTSQTGTNVQFVQNNYSPKALSRLDIYRQTKNQISTMKGLVTG